jgi:hypothetical protein
MFMIPPVVLIVMILGALPLALQPVLGRLPERRSGTGCGDSPRAATCWPHARVSCVWGLPRLRESSAVPIVGIGFIRSLMLSGLASCL